MNSAAAIEAFSIGSPCARDILNDVYRSLETGRQNAWFNYWVEYSSAYLDLAEADQLLVSEGSFLTSELVGGALFSAQTYASIVLDAYAIRLGVQAAFSEGRPSLFDWYRLRHPTDYARALEQLLSTPQLEGSQFSNSGPEDVSSFLGAFFQALFPPKVRHLLGEYYTPEWLIDDASTVIDTNGLPSDLTLLDPAAGSGGFAVRLLARICELRKFNSIQIVLSDISPIAVRFAELNVAYCMQKASEFGLPKLRARVVLGDTICDPVPALDGTLFAEPAATISVLGRQFENNSTDARLADLLQELAFESIEERQAFESTLKRLIDDRSQFLSPAGAQLICGNPPWISWDGVAPQYRTRIAAQWSGSSLVTNKGWRAKVAAGKNDLSTLFVLRSAERHAAPHATMVFALPISVFQGRHSSEGFRLFRAGASRRYAPTTILDLTTASVFSDAINRACLGVFRVDQQPSFPIRYGKLDWRLPAERRYDWHQARPIDSKADGSPIVVASEREVDFFEGIGASDYRARGGVNTGGANGILWVDRLTEADGRAEVINTGKVKGSSVRRLQGQVESGVVAPLLVGRDIRRWKAHPSRHVLFLYDISDPKRALAESEARRRFPKAYEYLSEFESELRGRKEYHRWGGTGPFYEMYRIGPYTFATHKVVWQHTGFRGRMNVAVISNTESPIVVPDQKVILIPFEDVAEAHYVCAYLASSIVEKVLNKYIGLDASSHILDYINMKKFNPENALHKKLAELSGRAHELASAGKDYKAVEAEIDKIAERLFFGLAKVAA